MQTSNIGMLRDAHGTIAVVRFTGLIDYDSARDAMEAQAAGISAVSAAESLWLMEHPPLVTAGTSARAGDLIDAGRFPVYRTRRGGQYTYHGPGQRMVYVMLDLRRRGLGARAFVEALQGWIIAALDRLGLHTECRDGRTGLWVPANGAAEAKIAAIGVQIRHGVSLHGAAVNVAPDLSHFDAIVPCGLPGFGVTSLAAQGACADLAAVDAALLAAYDGQFSGRQTAVCPLSTEPGPD